MTGHEVSYGAGLSLPELLSETKKQNLSAKSLLNEGMQVSYSYEEVRTK